MSFSSMNFLCLHVGKIISKNYVFRNRLSVLRFHRFSYHRLFGSLCYHKSKLELKLESG